jgi:Xaa-Pro aminopeptidase
MKYNKINPKLFVKNREKIAKVLPENSIAIINANDEMPRNGDQNFQYRQNSDLFYTTGIEQEQTILLIDPTGEDTLFIIKPNELMETWIGHKLTISEAKEFSGIKSVKYLEDFDFTLKSLLDQKETIYLNRIEYLKYDTDIEYRDIRFTKELKEKYPLHQFARLAPILTKFRLLKEEEELQLMQNACDITNKAFHRILKSLKPGMMEYEVEAEMTYEYLKNGASGHAYQPIVASGKNALVLHYVDNDQECKDGDLLLMDFGAEYGNYAADCSRTIPVNGKFTPRQKEVYESVLRVQNEAINHFKPGFSMKKMNDLVNSLIEKEMIKLGLFSKEDVRNQSTESPMYFKYMMHGVNHFIGLDVHDVGGKDDIFEEGMVLTIEPAIYIKEEGIGIRIEDNIIVGETPRNLMQDIPKEIDEIEALMNK